MDVIDSVYLTSSILFILSLGELSHPETSRRGNYCSITAMALAIGATLFQEEFHGNYVKFFLAFGLGGLIGLTLARTVRIDAISEMVTARQTFAGLAAVLIGFAKYFQDGKGSTLEMSLCVFIGAITFAGSVVAWGKFRQVIRNEPKIISGRRVINIVCIVGAICCVAMCGWDPAHGLYYLLGVTGIALFEGWLLVVAIGGLDVLVFIPMLNSCSGWAVSASGFLLKNDLLVITGALVGSSGAILSCAMCKARRPFFSAMMGGQRVVAAPTPVVGEYQEIKCEEIATALLSAKRIAIVPGFGILIARCQKDVGRLAKQLRGLGKQVEFCVHPTAGRLLGDMNVSLAEADIPFDILKEVEEVDFRGTDIVLVLGATDIVNPEALDNPQSEIAGMQVCEVWHSKVVVVFRRSKGGWVTAENPLCFKPNTRMCFGGIDMSVREVITQIADFSAKSAEAAIKAEQEDVSSPAKPKEAKGERVVPSAAKHLLLLGFVAIAATTDSGLPKLFLSFVLAILTGYIVIRSVTPSLHTPLITLTNAISGVIVIGAMLELKTEGGLLDGSSAAGMAATFFAGINVVGGFAVTQRILFMFKKEIKKN